MLVAKAIVLQVCRILFEASCRMLWQMSRFMFLHEDSMAQNKGFFSSEKRTVIRGIHRVIMTLFHSFAISGMAYTSASYTTCTPVTYCTKQVTHLSLYLSFFLHNIWYSSPAINRRRADLQWLLISIHGKLAKEKYVSLLNYYLAFLRFIAAFQQLVFYRMRKKRNGQRSESDCSIFISN